jgi:hypothetical protein
VFGTAEFGVDYFGTGGTVASTSIGRAMRFLPALFTASKQNQLYDDISTELIAGQVALDLDLDGAKMSFSGVMKNPRAVSPFVDFVAPFLRLIYEDGTEDYEQVGLFCLLPSKADSAPGGTVQELQGVDLCWLLDADHSTATTDMTLGANVVSEAVADLASGGITRHRIPASSYVSTKAVSWPPGTSRLRRVNDRLMMAGYYTICFDRHGIAMSLPYNDLSDVEPAVVYSTAEGTRLVPPTSDEPDSTGICNRVVVVGTDPSQPPIYAVRENTDPLSPVSFDNLGGIWLSVTREVSQLQDQAAADALAEEMLRNGASYLRHITLQTLPDPYRQPREVYQLDISNSAGVVADGKWRCSGWTLSLDWASPVMVHEIARTQAFVSNTP